MGEGISLSAPLKELRERLEMTQSQLAMRLGTARSYLSTIERGKNPFVWKMRQKVMALIEEKEKKDGVPRFGRPKDWMDDHIYTLPKADERLEEDLQKMETRILAYVDRQFSRLHARISDLEALLEARLPSSKA